MEQKQKMIAQILEEMRKGEITFEDLKEARLAALRPKCTENFDLLVVVDGVAQRVPFEEGKELQPTGIFPFKGAPFYMEFKETDQQDYPVELKDKLPGANSFARLGDIMPELNQRLKELGQPEFDGTYWLNGHEWSGIGYWVGKVHKNNVDTTYLDEKHKAKVRLLGYL